ncbi:MAG: hypothetical protein FWD77_11230 [Betaproteobacteria bacterium]|nr:hypothetical protein [Betaproteobacteria bacterium]
MAKFTRSRSCRLGLIVESGYLLAARWEAGLRGWQLATLETLPLMSSEADAGGKGGKADKAITVTPEAIALTLKSSLEHWKLPPQTPVVVVPPLSVGGIFPDPVGGETGKTPSAEVLAQNLPFASEEIIASWCSGTLSRKKTGSRADPRAALRGATRDFRKFLPQKAPTPSLGAPVAPENSVPPAALPSTPLNPAPIFWLPRVWVDRLCAALGRLGLRVEDFYHRGQLTTAALLGDAEFGLSAQSGQQAGLLALVETFGNGAAAFYAWNDGLLCRAGRLHDSSAALAAEIFNLGMPGARDAQAAPGLRQIFIVGDAAGDLAVPPGLASRRISRPLDLSAQLFRLYCRGDAEGIWLPPPQKKLLAPLTRNTIIAGIAGAALVAAFAWMASDARQEAQALETSIKKIKPRFEKIVAQEKRAMTAAAALRFQEDVARHPGALDPLLSAAQVFPEKVWLRAYQWKPDGKLELSGDGASGAEIVELLSRQPGWSQVRLVKRTEEAARKDEQAAKPPGSDPGAAAPAPEKSSAPAAPVAPAAAPAPAPAAAAAAAAPNVPPAPPALPVSAVAPATLPVAPSRPAAPAAAPPAALPVAAAAANPLAPVATPPRPPEFSVEAQWHPTPKAAAPQPAAADGAQSPPPASTAGAAQGAPSPAPAGNAAGNAPLPAEAPKGARP